MKTHQLAFSFGIREEATFTHFSPGRNQQLLTQLEETLLSNKGHRIIYFWGNTGVGCSHLLQASCHRAKELAFSAAYIPLKQFSEFTPAILEGLEQIPLICLDDLHQIAGQVLWEEAVFHLFNRVKETTSRLLMAAHASPAQAGFILPDLLSRLQWELLFQVHELTDEAKLILLKQKATARGFMLSNEVGEYLLRRCSRSMDVLTSVLEKLDRASLTHQRKLTIPFVKSVLAI
jgi:DnaA family protein